MANRNTAIITRLNGVLVEPDRLSATTPRYIALSVFDSDPGITTPVLADTWATMPAGAPTTGYDIQDDASSKSVYTLNVTGETALLAALSPGRSYRFVWRYIVGGILYQESKTVQWPTEAPAGYVSKRAQSIPFQFSPSVEKTPVDPDAVTLNESVIRASLKLSNLSVPAAAPVETWSGATSTPTPAVWSSATSYAVGAVSIKTGIAYVCMTASTNEDPTQTAWSSVTAYVVGNLVSSGGSSWKCTQANTNNTPVAGSVFWAEIWRPLTSSLVNNASIPLYKATRIVDGWYSFSAADLTAIKALLVHGNKYRATWTFVYNGATYTSTIDAVYEQDGRLRTTDKKFYGLTFSDLKNRLFNYLGSEPGTMTPEDLINEALVRFYQEAPWAFPQADTIYLDQYAGSNRLELPDDFGGAKVFMRANDQVHRCTMVTRGELAGLQERNWASTNQITFWCVVSDPPRSSDQFVRRAIEIYPAPSTTRPGAYRLDYLRMPPRLEKDTDVPPIPASSVPAFNQFLRAFAAEVEEEEGAPSERRKFNEMAAAALAQDGQEAGNFIGSVNQYTYHVRTGTDGFYLPVDPEQGPSYT